jgi:hypothetical protein
MHELRSHDDHPHTYTALAGLAANLLIPSALLIAGGKHPNPSVFRSASFGAAAGVTGAWWGMRSLGELK